MISSQQEMMAYKEACALNNWGVSMLLRGDYEDATTTIKDALSVLRLVLSPNNEHKSNLTNAVQRKAKKAVSRLSKLSKEACGSSYLANIIAIESNDFQQLRSASLPQASAIAKSSYHAVFIREQLSSDEETNAERESGIMLYNYALSCFLLSTTCQTECPLNDENKSEIFSGIAHRSLQLAHRTFTKRLMHMDDISEDLESVYFTTLVLQCSSKMFRVQENHSKANEAECAMNDLVAAVEDEHLDYLTVLSTRDVCAAAA